MNYYAITYTHTKMLGWALWLLAHVRYLKRTISDGNLVISGPLEISKGRAALLIFPEHDEKKLEALIAADPYYEKGLVAEMTKNLWDVQWGSVADITKHSAGKYYRVTYKLASTAKASSYEERQDAFYEAALATGTLRAAGSYVGQSGQGMIILTAANAAEASATVQKMPIAKEPETIISVREWKPKFE